MISSCVCCLEKKTLCEIVITNKTDVDWGLSDLSMGINDDESNSSGETQPDNTSTSVVPVEMEADALKALVEQLLRDDPGALRQMIASKGTRKRAREESDGSNPKKMTCLDDVKKVKTRLCQLGVDERLPYEKESAVMTFVHRRMFRGLKYVSKKELINEPRYVGMLFNHINLTDSHRKDRYRLYMQLVIYEKIGEHRNNSKGNIIRQFKKERTKGKLASCFCVFQNDW
jgi:hypothetical protein